MFLAFVQICKIAVGIIVIVRVIEVLFQFKLD